MSTELDHKALYEKLTAKVKLMRGLQKMRDRQGYLPVQDRERLNRVAREVDNMLLLDETGKKVFLKNN